MLQVTQIKNVSVENIKFKKHTLVLLKVSQRPTNSGNLNTTIKYIEVCELKNYKSITLIMSLLTCCLAEFRVCQAFEKEFSDIGLKQKQILQPFLNTNVIFRTNSEGKISGALISEVNLNATAFNIRNKHTIATVESKNLKAAIHKHAKAILAQCQWTYQSVGFVTVHDDSNHDTTYTIKLSPKGKTTMELSRPLWDSEDWEEAVEEVEKIEDKAILNQIAKEARCKKACEAAVERLTDQNLLADVAKNAKYSDIRYAAVSRVTAQDVLADIAKNANDGAIRRVAVSRVTAQDVLADIAKNANDSDICCAAVSRVTAQDVLADIAKNAYYSYIRRVAVSRITTQDVLADIAKNDKDSDVRRAAVTRITTQDVLADIAKNADYSDVRRAAVEGITAQDVLADIALNDNNSDVRRAAVKRITAQDVLADIVLNDNDRTVRCAAGERVADKIPLARIAKEASCLKA
ncbi:MAG: HEAT repeat domain-containing protein, partial [Tannerellaceae bacterium]|nr:HEAT repeat domain-containing protein [Tannerellaceae bacterium]